MHRAVLAGLEPGHEARLGFGEVDRRDTDLGESELLGPAAQLIEQARSVEPCLPLSMSLPAHLPILETRVFDWPDEAACAAFAARLARHPALWPSSFIALDGPLGAGKTTFVRHLLRALGVAGPIKSPTYAVLEPYEVGGSASAAPRSISHFDFYRFADPREGEDAGLREIFAAPGLKLVEWPTQAGLLLPPPDWWMELELQHDDQRRVNVHALSPHGRQLLAATA